MFETVYWDIQGRIGIISNLHSYFSNYLLHFWRAKMGSNCSKMAQIVACMIMLTDMHRKLKNFFHYWDHQNLTKYWIEYHYLEPNYSNTVVANRTFSSVKPSISPNLAQDANPGTVLKSACPEDIKTPPTCYNWLSFDRDI